MRSFYQLAFVGLVALAGNAAANEPTITLFYEAPWECPARAQFWWQLQARSTRLNPMKPGEFGIAIEARITGAGSRYFGHLRLAESGNAVVEREVTGPNCVDVSAALALITAVTLDASPARMQPDLSVTARPKKSRKRFALGAVGGIHKAVAPGVIPTIGLSVTYHDRAQFGSPELRLEGLYAWSPWQSVSGGGSAVPKARFLWMASRVTACPLQAQAASVTVGPCVLIELGALQGEGNTTSSGTQSKTGFWAAPGALLNWSMQAEPVWLRLAAGAIRPTVRDTFQFSPEPVVFRAPSLGLIAEFELAWAFY